MFGKAASGFSPYYGFGPFVAVTPFLEKQQLFNAVNFTQSFNVGPNMTIATTGIDTRLLTTGFIK